MESGTDHFDTLLRSAARRLKGHQRRLFMAEVARELCASNSRQAERRFGWGRETVEKGLHEARLGIQCLPITMYVRSTPYSVPLRITYTVDFRGRPTP